MKERASGSSGGARTGRRRRRPGRDGRAQRRPARAVASALLAASVASVAALGSGCSAGGADLAGDAGKAGAARLAGAAGVAAPPGGDAATPGSVPAGGSPSAGASPATGSATPSGTSSAAASAPASVPASAAASATASAPPAAPGDPSASGASSAPGPHRPGASTAGASPPSRTPELRPAAKPSVRPVPGAPAAGARPADAAGALASYAARVKATAAARLAAAKKWGLPTPPLLAPPPPAVKPVVPTRKGFEAEGGEQGLPPVFTRVPTKDKVVFLTIDDGSEKEPDFLSMMSELHVPYSAFLSDYLIKDDYGYFAKAQASGVTLSNHTLTHPYLPGLTHAQQEHEICGQQDKLAKEYGKRPTLFRPPYGNYNGDTLRIAKSCGIKAFPLWETEAFPTHMDWRDEAQHFEPGDIILTHFQGPSEWKATMVENVRNLLKRITDQGYAVARLEDYV
ncbi:hypothetical protein GCM10023082_35100 [Streptomyces tremellae]|uniref:NodB homology domain-containing protein n=1 Tax=Streptomyces tremellae TaxID=1124239 RepID=A0ABP7FAJ4_9ACTN